MKPIVIALILLAPLAGCMPSPAPDVVSAPKRDLTEKEKAMIAPVVANQLKDPAAAQFRWPKLVMAPGSAAYCGLVNGKNAYGGYVGFRPFLVRVEPSADGPIKSVSFVALNQGVDEYGIDWSGADDGCAHWGY